MKSAHASDSIEQALMNGRTPSDMVRGGKARWKPKL
jgi:hypothetical protein